MLGVSPEEWKRLLEVLGVIVMSGAVGLGVLVYLISKVDNKPDNKGVDIHIDEQKGGGAYLTYERANQEFVRKELFDTVVKNIECDILEIKQGQNAAVSMLSDLFGILSKQGVVLRKTDSIHRKDDKGDDE